MRVLFRSLVVPAALALSQVGVSACGLIWEATLADTLALAQKTHRFALVFVTGSDWSPRSIRLDADVWMKPEFFDCVTRSFALFDADFPQRARLSPEALAENTELARKYRVKHFPTMLLLRPDGSEVERLEYRNETARDVLQVLKAATERASAATIPSALELASP